MSMTKAEFIECMEKLWDAGGRINVNVIMKHYQPRREGSPSKDTQALADRFQEMITAGEWPFDIPVVSTKEILRQTEFRDFSATRVGRALALIGGKKAGQVIDGYQELTSVWIVSDHDRLVGSPRSRLEYIIQRRTD